MTNKTNKEIVTQFFLDGYVNLNFDNLLTLMADTYLDHSPCHATSNRECIEVLKNTARIFSNMHVEICDLIEEDDKVMARVLFSCKHTGTAYDIPATQANVKFEALEVFRIKDGQIVESWGYWPDSLIKAQLLALY